MRLADLSPVWIERDGRRIGIVFLCPHCVAARSPRPTPMSCFCVPSPPVVGWPEDGDGQTAIFADLVASHPAFAGNVEEDFVPCAKGVAWAFSGEDFGTLSITPSLDASAAGHWHGFITNGEVR